MKPWLVLVTVTMFFASPQRVFVVTQNRIVESLPPESIQVPLREARQPDQALVALVRIEQAEAVVGVEKRVCVQYQAEVLDVLTPVRTPNQALGNPVRFRQEGGAVFMENRIVVGTPQYYGELAVGQTYVVMLRRLQKGLYSLTYGRYSAYQILGGHVLSVARDSEGLIKRYDGLSLVEFKKLILEEYETWLRIATKEDEPKGGP